MINRLISSARRVGVPVIYTRVEHGPRVDLPPYRAKYEPRGMYETDTLCHEDSWGAQLSVALEQPLDTEMIVVKHGYDAFQAPELDLSLRGGRRKNVVVTGFVTNLCVAATAAAAFERGYFVVVPEDCVGASNVQAAEVTLETIRSFYGDVIPSSTILSVWSTTPSTGDEPRAASVIVRAATRE